MPKYAQILHGRVVSVSHLAGEVDAPHMVPITDDDDVLPGDEHDGQAFSHPAPAVAVRSWTVLEFKRLLTPAERVAIRQARKTDPVVEDFLDLLDTTALSNARVMADDEDLAAGLAYMEAQGLLAAGRADEILVG